MDIGINLYFGIGAKKQCVVKSQGRSHTFSTCSLMIMTV